MTFEVSATASRATRRVVGIYLTGATVIAATLVPVIARALSEPTKGGVELLSLLGIGALLLAGMFTLASIVGFIAARRARVAAATLRTNDVGTPIRFGRLAPENPIVALTVKRGELGAWIDEDGELVRLAYASQIQTIELTAQKIGRLDYYALRLESHEGTMLVTLGTQSTWGAAEASRRAHVRLAETLLG